MVVLATHAKIKWGKVTRICGMFVYRSNRTVLDVLKRFKFKAKVRKIYLVFIKITMRLVSTVSVGSMTWCYYARLCPTP